LHEYQYGSADKFAPEDRQEKPLGAYFVT